MRKICTSFLVYLILCPVSFAAERSQSGVDEAANILAAEIYSIKTEASNMLVSHPDESEYVNSLMNMLLFQVNGAYSALKLRRISSPFGIAADDSGLEAFTVYCDEREYVIRYLLRGVASYRENSDFVLLERTEQAYIEAIEFVRKAKAEGVEILQNKLSGFKE